MGISLLNMQGRRNHSGQSGHGLTNILGVAKHLVGVARTIIPAARKDAWLVYYNLTVNVLLLTVLRTQLTSSGPSFVFPKRSHDNGSFLALMVSLTWWICRTTLSGSAQG